jgi:hypothetical protein
MAAGAKGVKISFQVELVERKLVAVKIFQGSIPTQTLRANIDYYEAPAKTRSGYVGVKVWIIMESKLARLHKKVNYAKPFGVKIEVKPEGCEVVLAVWSEGLGLGEIQLARLKRS